MIFFPRVWPLIALFLALGGIAQAGESDSVTQPALVVLIDDVGDNLARGEAAVELPGPITYAILPHSPFGKLLARKALADDKEVMLHAPMQNTHNRPLGPGALTSALDRQEFIKVLEQGLDFVPGVVGMNNHMGSLLTRLRPQMSWVMEVVKQRELFFLDSRTTADSVAWKVARDSGVPYLRRDVFLDHERTPEFVEKQFLRALKIARKRGVAVIIGHPYPVTVNFLQKALPLLDEQGVRLLSASGLLLEQQHQRQLTAYYRQQKRRSEQVASVVNCDPSVKDCDYSGQ
ncbi:MAG: divergent polysaccharide deacetylase family protein [Motiliproteus sp.]|nr:divergent polysaccharide deacetylase family protein [Motiliproteus sp.]MCW9053582.1 divergent polysaccharide deacetylase family protein [Motiliproteus sp.]